jgi:Asp-tRNA(Asn)/Glu-tRNA(Gln) amidotransferase A subunit family amidase
MTTAPSDLTITEAANLLERRALSPLALLQSCLDRIEALEHKLHAWVLIDREGALREAARCEKEIRDGRRRGPLHGIPLGVKDVLHVAGMPTAAGSRARSGVAEEEDAAAVRRLRDAGAIILGKLQTAEFAFRDPPPTRNPWNFDHTPGGSSSGSAAAVAAGMCLAALGSQTGGSTLRPACFCGVVGLKPRHGRVSAYGMVPFSPALDHVGIFTRSIEDAALVLEALSGFDPRDPYALDEDVPGYRVAVEEDESPPRIGIAREGFFEHATSEMLRHSEHVCEELARAGAHVEDVHLSGIAALRDAYRTIVRVDLARSQQATFATRSDDYGPFVRAAIEEGLAMPAVAYATALENRQAVRHPIASTLTRFDAILTPGAEGAAPYGVDTGSAALHMPWSVLGFPALVLPTGLDEAGLPLGVQLVSSPAGEARLLSVAAWCERTLGRTSMATIDSTGR